MNNLSFISNNAKRVMLFRNRLRYLNTWKIASLQMVSFFSRKNSSVKDENVWNDKIEGQFFFSQGKTNSSGVAIGWVHRF